MFRYLRGAARGLSWSAKVARRRPWLTLSLTLLLLTAATLGGLWYVHYCWQAAQAALAQGRPAEARSHLNVCLLVWPRDAEVHRLAARAARMNGDPRGAEDYLKRCLELQGGANQAVQLEFLLLRVQMGEVDEVVPTLLDCIEKKHPEAPLILEAVAGAYIHRYRYQAAYAFLNHWVEVQPNVPKPYQWRGWVLERLNRHKAAGQDYARALELNPDLVLVRLRLAEMLLEENRAPEAVPHLERLYREIPTNPGVLARLGAARFVQNHPEEARRLMEAALPHLPDDPVLLIYLARLDTQDGRPVDAERRLRKVLRADPYDTEALHALISVLQLQNRRSEAAAALDEFHRSKERMDRVNKLLREVVDTPIATPADEAELGELLLQGGRQRQGVYWLKHALERDPNQQRAHTALADHYESKGEREQAAEHRDWLRRNADKVTKSKGG